MRYSLLAGLLLALLAATALAQPKPRTTTEVDVSLADNWADLRKLAPVPQGLIKKADRTALAPDGITLLRKRLALFNEYAAIVGPPATTNPELRYQQVFVRSLLIVLGDEEATRTMDAVAKRNTLEGVNARLAQSLAQWFDSADNASAQGKVLDTMRSYAKALPTDDALTRTLVCMSEHAATTDLAELADEVIVKDLRGPDAMIHKNLPKLDKPIQIAGNTPTGQPFSTKTWKGKVILVHFWAIGTESSRLAHADLRNTYKTYHEKGLEIVGIASAPGTDQMVKYVAEKGFAWPELFDPQHPTRNNLMAQCGVGEFNTVFLIDRNGILRSRDALAELDKLIPPLLDEKPSAQPATKPATP